MGITLAAWQSDSTWDDDKVNRRSLSSIASVAGACLVLAGTALAAGPAASLPPGWSHADVNVVIGRKAHTLTFDRGRVIAVGNLSLTLRELDGTVLTIPVAPNATIRVNGRPGTFSQIKPGSSAQTRRLDGGPAGLVQATVPPRLLKPVKPPRSGVRSGSQTSG